MTYIPHTQTDIKEMLSSIGVNSIEELFTDIPACLLNPKINLNNGIDEISLTKEINDLANLNTYNNYTSFLGAGSYDHYIPAVVDSIISRSEFYTAYTPYQPETSQGMLQAIFEYQTMTASLCGLDISNASLYDGATALWEAILIACRKTKKKHVAIIEPIHPNYMQVIKTYARFSDILLISEKEINEDTACIITQYPNFFGQIKDLSTIAETANKNKALFIAISNPLALALFETPAAFGADIIVGEGQPLGIPLAFGGPYLGFITAKAKFLRQMPGRIAGKTVDKNGKTGYTLTIQTREQHIRREKATSNICSNQALMALSASVYMSYMGKTGLKKIAQICFDKCIQLKEMLNKLDNIKINMDEINFNEFTIELSSNAEDIIQKARKQNLIPGYPMGNKLLIAVTEKTTEDDMNKLCELLQHT